METKDFKKGKTVVSEFRETVINIRRVAKVVKGGRRFNFSTMVVVGDGAGRVGLGIGKSREVASSILKAVQAGKKNLITVQINEQGTIPYTILGKYGAAKVLMKPASEGTGVIAGGAVRAVLDAAGIKNILSKSLGSDNSINIAKATYNALKQLMHPDHIKNMRSNDGISAEKSYNDQQRNNQQQRRRYERPEKTERNERHSNDENENKEIENNM